MFYSIVLVILFTCTIFLVPLIGMAYKEKNIWIVENGNYNNSYFIPVRNNSSKVPIILKSNTKWKIIMSNLNDWLSTDKTSGGSGTTEVTITALENTSTSSRTATIYVKSSDSNISIPITINQAAKVYTISANKSSQIMPTTTYKFLVTITSNGAYSAYPQESWLTAVNAYPDYSTDSSGNTWLITATENTTGSARTGSVKFESTVQAGVSVNILISQDYNTNTVSSSDTTIEARKNGAIYYSNYVSSSLVGTCTFLYPGAITENSPTINNVYVQFKFLDGTESELYDITEDNLGQGIALNCGTEQNYVTSLRWGVNLATNNTGTDLTCTLDTVIWSSNGASNIVPTVTVNQAMII